MKKLVIVSVLLFNICHASVEDAEAIRELSAKLENAVERISKLEKEVEILKAKETTEEESENDPILSKKEITNEEGQQIINEVSTLIDENSLETAEKKLKKFIEVSPNHLYVGQAYFCLGMVKYRGQNYKDSALCFMNSLKHNPRGSKAPECSYYLGLTLEKLKRNQEAKKVFERLVSEFPGEFANRAKSKIKSL